MLIISEKLPSQQHPDCCLTKQLCTIAWSRETFNQVSLYPPLPLFRSLLHTQPEWSYHNLSHTMSLLCSNLLTASHFTQGKSKGFHCSTKSLWHPSKDFDLISKESALHSLGSGHTSFLAVTQTCRSLLTSGSLLFSHIFIWLTRHFIPVSAQMPLPQRAFSGYPTLFPCFLVAPVLGIHFISCISLPY